MARPKINILGQRFGRLVVIASVSGGWLCRCDCGTEKHISGGHLRTGRTISCGCYISEKVKLPRTHGLRNSRAWKIWSGMIQRCSNPNHARYSSYGGRGITFCYAWKTFEGFYADMGEPPPDTSLDRIDNDRGYMPSNCRWASKHVQARNTNTNRVIEIGGSGKTLAEWCELRGLPYTTVHSRMRRGWTAESALGFADHAPQRRPS